MYKTLRDICNMITWHPNFWNPTKLFSKKDSRGELPGIYCAVSNRTGGKTYGISQVLLKYNEVTGRKFGIICKTQNDLGKIAVGVLGGVLEDKYPNFVFEEKVSPTKRFSVLTKRRVVGEDEDDADVETEEIGYVLALNAASKLKDYSSMFRDCDVLFMDEFQTDRYLPDEIGKLISLRGSVARGNSTGVRYVPVIMCSNSISIVNPYFVAWGISTKIQSNTHFLKAPGIVLERFTNKVVADAQRMDPFNVAFANHEAIACSVDNSWLNDSWACVAKPTNEWGGSWYICTIIDGDEKYAVRKYDSVGLYYINKSIDKTCPTVYNISIDGVENIPMIQTGGIFKNLRAGYAAGVVRFADIRVKDIMTKIFV